MPWHAGPVELRPGAMPDQPEDPASPAPAPAPPGPVEFRVDPRLAALKVAGAVIFLLLTAYFQSVRLALISVAAVPAVIVGVALALLLTRTTLNIHTVMRDVLIKIVMVPSRVPARSHPADAAFPQFRSMWTLPSFRAGRCQVTRVPARNRFAVAITLE